MLVLFVHLIVCISKFAILIKCLPFIVILNPKFITLVLFAHIMLNLVLLSTFRTLICTHFQKYVFLCYIATFYRYQFIPTHVYQI